MLYPDQPAGLRARKKAKTRAAIREHALRLFREQGYTATTVDQIAEAAEISPATFYRYYPTKEDVVIQDDIDLVTIEAFEAQPAELSPIAAMRAAAAATFGGLTAEDRDRLKETTELTLSTPEIRARALDEFARTIQAMAEAVARRTGHDPGDFAVRNLAAAMMGVMMGAAMPLMVDPSTDIFAAVDAGLAHLEAGLPL